MKKRKKRNKKEKKTNKRQQKVIRKQQNLDKKCKFRSTAKKGDERIEREFKIAQQTLKIVISLTNQDAVSALNYLFSSSIFQVYTVYCLGLVQQVHQASLLLIPPISMVIQQNRIFKQYFFKPTKQVEILIKLSFSCLNQDNTLFSVFNCGFLKMDLKMYAAGTRK